jgi:hypothetical protein
MRLERAENIERFLVEPLSLRRLLLIEPSWELKLVS